MAESELQNVLLQTVGRSHPLLVHFPVALLVVAAASELGGLWRRSPEAGMAWGLVWFALPQLLPPHSPVGPCQSVILFLGPWLQHWSGTAGPELVFSL